MNAKYTIAQIAIPSLFRHVFDYLIPNHVDPQDLKIGVRVRIPFKTKEMIGIFPLDNKCKMFKLFR